MNIGIRCMGSAALALGIMFSTGVAQAQFIGWACGGVDTNGGVLLCTTNGVDWFRQGVGQLGTHAMSGVAAAGRHVWVVGDPAAGYAAVYHSADYGATWARQGSAMTLPTGTLHKIWAVDRNVLWAVGPDGAVAVTGNGGQNWQCRPVTNCTALLQGVTAVDRWTAWVSGEEDPASGMAGMFYTQDGGGTWTAQTSPAITNAGHLLGLAALDANRVWAIGGNETILATTNAGAQWDLLSSGSFKDGNEIRVLDDQRIWAAYDSHVDWTTNGGATWGSEHTTDYTMDVATPDGTNVWAISGNYWGGTIHHSDDGGATWTNTGVIACGGLLFKITVQRHLPPRTLYVNAASGNATPPYTSWDTAASNIQDAVDLAMEDDTVLVTNGVYNRGGRALGTNSLANRVLIEGPITVRSVNGAAATTIAGAQDPVSTNGPAAVRCVWLASDATLAGFTLANGATRAWDAGAASNDVTGGGAWCQGQRAIVMNCVLNGNSAAGGGGVYGGTLYGCTLSGNAAGSGGGAQEATLHGCTLASNSAVNGGGAYHGELYGCILAGNTAGSEGGGVKSSDLYICLLRGNQAGVRGGGAAGQQDGAYTNPIKVVNCTIVDNLAPAAGGVHCGTILNSVLHGNQATLGETNYDGYCTLAYSCAEPLYAGGPGNLAANPRFANATAGNYRLQADSPCINAGTNEAWMTGAPDLAGNRRIIGPTVDMGVYEYPLAPTSLAAATNSSGCLQLTWTGVTGAGGYAIFRSTTTNVPSEALSVVSTTTYCDATAKPGQHYYYWVNAHYATEASTLSASAIGWLRGVALPWLMLLLE